MHSDWEYHQVDGEELARVSVEASSHPVYDTKGDQARFWWRTPVGTIEITEEAERDRIIARRWP